jgi:hypothetical protein
LEPFEGLVEGETIGFEILADAPKIVRGHPSMESAESFAPRATPLGSDAFKRLSLL